MLEKYVILREKRLLS